MEFCRKIIMKRTLYCLNSIIQNNYFDTSVFCVSIVYFLLLSSIPSYGFTTICSPFDNGEYCHSRRIWWSRRMCALLLLQELQKLQLSAEKPLTGDCWIPPKRDTPRPRVEGTECSSACVGPFEGGLHYLHYLHCSLASSQTTGRKPSPTHQEKTGLKIYWAWPCPSEQDHFPLKSVSPSGSFHKPLILLHQRADRMKSTITEN